MNLNNNWWPIRLRPAFAIAFLCSLSVSGELSVREIRIGPAVEQSRVPDVTQQGQVLAPQAVSALDIAADGKVITVGTMAFSHDANVWQFSPDGAVLAKRYFPPWAPMQVTTLSGGRAMAIGLAYSRVTSPEPTVWFGPSENLFAPALSDKFSEADPTDGQLARLRPGEGDWQTGWFASSIGELFVRGPDWMFKPPRSFMDAEGHVRALRFEEKSLLPTSRAMRMAASADGRRLAFGWLGFSKEAASLARQVDSIEVWEVGPNRKLWSAPPTIHTPPMLPDPVADFPDLAKDFRLRPDAVLPGHVAASIALNRDGSRAAIVEYGIWGWMRKEPAIGKWDPPIHLLNFLPNQRGRLRVFNGSGQEILSELLPGQGVFEVGFSADTNEVWCWPASWFARGMASQPWLPVDRRGKTIYRIALEDRAANALVLPDAVADCALAATHRRTLISCWDGWLCLLNATGKLEAQQNIGSPARVTWSDDGAFAVAGTADGRLIRVEQNGKIAWERQIEMAEIPRLPKPPTEVVPGVPVFQGGRIPGSEHAYVGDIWMIKTGDKAVFVDAGGTSGLSQTQTRLRALGVEQVTHVLQTHTHGDHCGGAYLWRAAGAKIVAPKAASFSQTWLMPMLTDYGIYPPRPVDIPLLLARVGDETDFEVSGLKFHALFVPGHSFDLTIFTTILDGKRVAFTGDLGFENQDIVHRCWGDAGKARSVVRAIRDKLLPWQPEIVFTGHGVRTNGLEFLRTLVEKTEASIAQVGSAP